MATVAAVATATLVGLGYGGCQALREHAAAVNGTAAMHLLAACSSAATAATALPERAGEAIAAASSVSMGEWRLELSRTLALTLVGQAVLTALVLMVRWPPLSPSASARD